MAGRKKRTAAHGKAVRVSPDNAGPSTTYQVEKLTGVRAQAGKLPNDAPRWTYEVNWKGHNKTTFEPATNLVNHTKEMAAIDEKYKEKANAPEINVAKMANAARESAAKKNHKDLMERRERLLRLSLLRQQSRKRVRDGEEAGEEGGGGEEEDGEEGEDVEFRELNNEDLGHELQLVANQLAAAGIKPTGDKEDPTPTAIPPASTVSEQSKKRSGTSRVWQAFDRNTNRCTLPHKDDKTKVCGKPPNKGGGTSGHIQHLSKEHAVEWEHIQRTGVRKTTVDMIKDALKAKVDLTTPSVTESASDELDKLTALWVTKCGRPQAIVHDKELRALLARILELCKAKLRYELPTSKTVKKKILLLGTDGKALGRDFVVRLLKSGVRPTISGDLWSEGGMGLFGIYAHGISKTFVLEKALIGLVACASWRHTGDNIKKWTDEALLAMGLSPAMLTQPSPYAL